MAVRDAADAVTVLKKRAAHIRAQIAAIELLKAELAKVERMIAAAEEP
jgi:hypothetical protein